MECSCVRYTELPHTSRLFSDFLYHPDRLLSLYPVLPSDDSSYSRAAALINYPEDRRAALVKALRQQNGSSASLDRLAQPGTTAVVTGQQVGLFSGPAYTLYKALTAVRLARQLSDAGTPAVPVFWLATEDHDFAEVNHCWVFNEQHTPVKLEMPRSPGSNQPVGRFVLQSPPVAELRSALQGFPFSQEVTAWVEQAYQPGRTMGEAFSALLKELLAAYDLVHVDPMSPAIRELAAPLVRSALRAAPDLYGALSERNRELAAAGYHAQVHVENETSFVFLLENDRRLTLRRNERDYSTNGRRFTTEELIERAAELSPNALLRPVVQDYILPTVAYVGGPAELAYLAQSEVIYRAILGRMPVPLHRAGFTLLDQRSRRLMLRYGLSLMDCFHGEQILRERIALRLIPPAVGSAIKTARDTVHRATETLAAEIASFDAALAASLEKSRRKINYQIDKIERKIGRETFRRDERAGEEARYLHNLVYPQRHLQERLYSILPFFARHGLDLAERLYENVRLDCPDHQLLVL